MRTVTTDESTRLHFKADVIEPLRMDDVFEIITPRATWRMTKADFYRLFPNVLRSKSYAGARREYHYPTPPGKAEQFRVGNNGGGGVVRGGEPEPPCAGRGVGRGGLEAQGKFLGEEGGVHCLY